MEKQNLPQQNTHSPIKTNVLQHKINKLEVKDVLPNTNRMQAAERAEKCGFCPW